MMYSYYQSEKYPIIPVSFNELPLSHILLFTKIRELKLQFAIRGGLSLDLLCGQFSKEHHDIDILALASEKEIWLSAISPMADSSFFNNANLHGLEVLTLFFYGSNSCFYQIDVRFHERIPQDLQLISCPNSLTIPCCSLSFSFWERAKKILFLLQHKENQRLKKHLDMFKKILVLDHDQSNEMSDSHDSQCEFYNPDIIINLLGFAETEGLLDDLKRYIIRHGIKFNSNFRRILFCRFRAPGDIIRTFPIISGLKFFHPEIEIGYVCYERHADILQCNKDISYIHTINEPEKMGKRVDFRPWCKAIEEIKKLNYDLFYDLHGISHSAVLGIASGIRHRIGFAEPFVKEGAELFYTEIYNLPTRATNRFLRHEYLVQRKIPYVYNMRCRNLLIPDSNKYNIVLCPGSSQVGILKRWPIDSYIELAKKIEASGESVLFVLGNEDADLIQKIKGASFAYEQFDDIKKLFYYTRNAKCVIGNDSAWLHAACVQGTPNVMIVGPSPFIVCHTNDITLHKTVYKKAECAPCKVWQYKCPNKHICMKSIEVEDVFSTVCDIMKNIL